MKKKVLTFFVSLTLIISAFAQDTLFVKNSDESTAWAGRTTYTNLQDAIDAAQSGDMIWVEAGLYRPTSTFDNSDNARCKSFVMKENISLYGGFVGTEVSLEERDADTATVLSGDFGTPDDDADNVYHVVYCKDISNVILDGFTITGGNANRDLYPDEQCGGGVYMGPNGQLRNCYIINNRAQKDGGGVWVPATGSLTDCYFLGNSVTATNSSGGAAYFYTRSFDAVPAAVGCYFEGNSCAATTSLTGSNRFGGGAVNAGQNAIFEGCVFLSNHCTNPGGAVICSSANKFEYCMFYLNQATSGACIYGGNSYSFLASNCLLANNKATANGGAIYVTGTSCRAINCTFVNNVAAAGDAVYGSNGFTLFNSIVWSNDTVPENQLASAGATGVKCMYTAIQGVTVAGEGNLNVTTEDIAFSDPCSITGVPEGEEQIDSVLYAEYYIQSQSVCKDAGSVNTLELSGYQFPATDLYDEARVIGGAIDLGCFENICENIAPAFTWRTLDTTFNTIDTGTGEVSDGTGTVVIEFTVTNYDEDYDYFLASSNGFNVMMESNTVTATFNFPGTYSITVSYSGEDCGAHTDTTITLDSLFAPVGIVENGFGTLSLYPNPATSTLTMESSSPVREITVYDLMGRTMMTTGNGTASLTHTLNVSSLPAGIYILRAVTNNGVRTARFVKN